jgi:hypothetical protein
MGSQYPPSFYDDETLAVLEQALRDVWRVLKAREPYPNWENNPDLTRHLAFKLMSLADAGVRDPEELRSRALEGFPLVRRTE